MRRRIADERLLLGGADAEKLKVNVCVGTNCFVKGSQGVLHDLLHEVEAKNLQDQVQVSASFCFENCEHGPTVHIDGKAVHHCTGRKACELLSKELES